MTVTHLPITRCQICHMTVAYQPGTLSEVLTEHYGRAHPKRSASLPGNRPQRPGATPADTVTGVDRARTTVPRAGRESASGHGVWPPLVRAPHVEPPFGASC